MSRDPNPLRLRRLFHVLLLALPLAAGLSCGPPSPVLIGGLIPESGSASVYGKSIRNGMTLALEDVNARGGVLGGRRLEIEFHDTRTDPEAAEVHARALLDKGVPVVIGAGASPVSLRLAPLFNKNEVVLLSPSSSSPKLTTDGGDWFFRVYPSDVGESYRLAKFCRDNVVSKAAVLAEADSFGEGAGDEFVARYKAATRQVVYRADFEPGLDAAKARTIVREMAAAGPEAVFIVAYIDDMAELLAAMETEKVRILRLGTSAVTPELVKKAGSAAEGLIFPTPQFDPARSEEPRVKEFVKRYTEKFGEAPNNFALKGYEAVDVIAQAIDVAELAVPKNIRGALLTSEFRGVSGNFQFDIRGDVTQAPRLYAVHNGEIVEYEKYRDALLNKSILAR